jgi:hypothetical protein
MPSATGEHKLIIRAIEASSHILNSYVWDTSTSASHTARTFIRAHALDQVKLISKFHERQNPRGGANLPHEHEWWFRVLTMEEIEDLFLR